MFTNIFFLILLILLIGFVPEIETLSSAPQLYQPLMLGLAIYFILLLVIFFQNRLNKNFTRRNLTRMLALTNIELLAFFCFFYFILYAHEAFPHSQSILSIVSVILYFIGLGVHHLSTYSLQNYSIRSEYLSPVSYMLMQLGFLIPFVIPFILLSLFIDMSAFIPNDSEWGSITIFIFSFVTFFSLLIFFPVALQYFWRCRPITDITLKKRFEDLCKKLNFKHSGIMTWSIMKHALTAGVIGIVPRFRYIMFTDRILRELPPEPLEAILAHEIAHSKLKHLLYYPFIIIGMSLVAAIVFLLLGDNVSSPIAAFFIYGFIALLYLRIVFGYFSRLFERQADLYVFAAGIPHYYMLQALDFIGVASGNAHLLPSWHHYGIQERIDFLCDAAIDRELIIRHNKWVKWSLITYFTLFILTLIIIFGASS